MKLDPWLLELLVDPLDHGALYYVPSAEVLVNQRTSQVYSVVDGIATLLPAEARIVTADELEQLLASDGLFTGSGN